MTNQKKRRDVYMRSIVSCSGSPLYDHKKDIGNISRTYVQDTK